MFSTNLKQLAFSSLGAVALSATCIFAAVAPVRAANAPLTTYDWQQAVSNRVSSRTDMLTSMVRPGQIAETTLVLRFNAEGSYVGATVRRTSGLPALDRHAVAIADRTTYPALPAGYRGAEQTVVLRLAFGDEQAVTRHLARAEELPSSDGAVRTAAR